MHTRDELEQLVTELVGSPQLVWDERYARWRPAGTAIRCVVDHGAQEPTVWIDEVELTLEELASMLSSHGAPVCLVFLDD